jgi:hypothetical protein
MIELTLQINAENMGSTLEPIFATLSLEEKKAIATQVLTKFIEEPYLGELQVKKTNFAIQKRTNRAYKGYNPQVYATEMTDDEIVKEWAYEFNEYCNKNKGSKQIMVEDVLQAAVSTFRERTTEMVKNNEELKVIFAQVAEKMKEDFPKLVHDIMMTWFTTQLTGAMALASQSLQQSNMNTEYLQDIRNKLH